MQNGGQRSITRPRGGAALLGMVRGQEAAPGGSGPGAALPRSPGLACGHPRCSVLQRCCEQPLRPLSVCGRSTSCSALVLRTSSCRGHRALCKVGRSPQWTLATCLCLPGVSGLAPTFPPPAPRPPQAGRRVGKRLASCYWGSVLLPLPVNTGQGRATCGLP